MGFQAVFGATEIRIPESSYVLYARPTAAPVGLPTFGPKIEYLLLHARGAGPKYHVEFPDATLSKPCGVVVPMPTLPELVLLILVPLVHCPMAFCEQPNSVIAVRAINMPLRIEWSC